MNAHEKHRIIRGEVFVDGRWVPMSRKVELDRQYRKKIEEGYVFYRGEWMTIEEKLFRVLPPKPPEATASSSIVINNYDNRSYATIDKRTVHHHEHRHVHVNGERFDVPAPDQITGGFSAQVPAEIGTEADGRKALPDGLRNGMIDNEGKNRKLLMPPEDE